MTANLTPEMIEGGRRLLERLDRTSFGVRACFWFYFSESDRWRLVVASPEVRNRGPHAAYRKIHAAARWVPAAAGISALGVLRAMEDTDPLVGALRKAVPRRSGTAGTRLTRSGVDGTFIDDAYIYRLRGSSGPRKVAGGGSRSSRGSRAARR